MNLPVRHRIRSRVPSATLPFTPLPSPGRPLFAVVFLVLPALVVLSLGATRIRAQEQLINAFTDPDSVLGVWDWWGGAQKEIAWDSDDADGDPNSGSLRLAVTFDPALEDNQYSIGFSLAGGAAYDGSLVASAATYGTLAFDIRWNDESTTPLEDYNSGAGGDPGFFVGLATSEWGQTWLGGVSLNAGEWQRIEIPIPAGAPDFPGLVFKKWSPGGGGAEGLAGLASVSIDNIVLTNPAPVEGETVLLNGFDDESTPIGFWIWWGAIYQEITWDGEADAEGRDDSGAIRMLFEFDNTLDDNQYAIGWALSGLGSYEGSVVASASEYAALAFDLRWDAAASTIPLENFNTGSGDAGFYMGFATTSWGQSWIQNPPALTEEWQRVVIPIGPATPDFAGLVFKKWTPGGGSAEGMSGTAALWIDNISLIRRAEATPPPTLDIEPAGPKGLRLTASASGEQYQRQSVLAVAAEDTFWVGSDEPVSYLIEFADFPLPDRADFQAHLFLSPNSGGGDTPDWNDPTVLFFDIHAGAADFAECHVRYKINEPNGNSMFYAAGALGTHAATSILGLWTLTLANDTDITVTAPDGSSSTFYLPEADAALFARPGFMSTHFGVQPNQLAHIGQSATFSRIAIFHGETVILDDRFETGDPFQQVDPTWWTVLADPEAIAVIRSDQAYWLEWTLPASGWMLYGSRTLGEEDPWVPIRLPAYQLGDRMRILLQDIDLPGEDLGFFHLRKEEEPPLEP